jgi:hypothetical protein
MPVACKESPTRGRKAASTSFRCVGVGGYRIIGVLQQGETDSECLLAEAQRWCMLLEQIVHKTHIAQSDGNLEAIGARDCHAYVILWIVCNIARPWLSFSFRHTAPIEKVNSIHVRIDERSI